MRYPCEDCVSSSASGRSHSLRGFALLSQRAGLLFVLFTDLIEPLHVLEELGAPLKGDEKLCLLAVASVV